MGVDTHTHPCVLNEPHGLLPSGAVHIVGPSRWGNPFVIGRDGDRQL